MESLLSQTRFMGPRLRWLYVAILILVLSSIEPLLHWGIPRVPPAGAVHSGLHTVDTYAYMAALRYYPDGKFSPYAHCHSSLGDSGGHLYALPHHRLYGIAGYIAQKLSCSPFLFLGFLNGAGLAFFLFSSYILFRTSAPRLADSAFLIFCLGGGIGGIAFCTACYFGWVDNPEFSRYFLRYFVYELNEGARFQPYLLAARFYYTFPLAFACFSLAFLLRFLQTGTRYIFGISCLCILLSSFLNMRVGPMVWAGGMLAIAVHPKLLFTRRLLLWGGYGLACAVGVGMTIRMLTMNPELSQSVFQSLSGIMWLLPFISATFFYWLLVPGELRRSLDFLPSLFRYGAYAVLGYLTVYIISYLGYQAYQGNWFYGGDTSAAIAVSDYALLGILPGLLAAWFFKPKAVDLEKTTPSWMGVWFLCFLALSLSAFGHGWFLQFMPQRCMVVLGIPLSILVAASLNRLQHSFPRISYAVWACILIAGGTSIIVTWGVAHGPFGHHTVQRIFPWTNYLYIMQDDAALLESLEEGVLLAPSLGDPLFGDIAVQRAGLRTVYGNGTMDYSHQVMPEVRKAVFDFFQPKTSEGFRKKMLQKWCVRYVYCPAFPPVRKSVLASLRSMPVLHEIAAAGGGAVFEVLP